jgi:hypothetical protein
MKVKESLLQVVTHQDVPSLLRQDSDELRAFLRLARLLPVCGQLFFEQGNS